jgi:hypothetical protein
MKLCVRKRVCAREREEGTWAGKPDKPYALYRLWGR